MSPFKYAPHFHIAARRNRGPVRVADQHRTDTPVARFNTRVAIGVTKIVGSMWCAYAFAAFDMISLPAALHGGASTFVAWFAQTFLQLVLLSVIMVGQNVQAAAADARSEAMYADAGTTMHEVGQVQAHQAAQDAVLAKICEHFGIDTGETP